MHSSLTPNVLLRRAQGLLQRGGQPQAALPRWLRAHAPKAGHGGRAAAEAALGCSGQGWVRAGPDSVLQLPGLCALWSGSSGALCTYL